MRQDVHDVIDGEAIVFDHDHELFKEKGYHYGAYDHQDCDVDAFNVVFPDYISICDRGDEPVGEIEGHDVSFEFAEHFDRGVALRVELIVD